MPRFFAKPPAGAKLDGGDPLARGLFSAYLFNEGGGGVVYSSASAANGTFVNNPVRVPTPYGKGISFNGTDQKISLDRFPTSLPLTIAALVRPGGAGNYAIVTLGSSPNYAGLGINDNRIYSYVNDTGSSNVSTTSGTMLSTGQWALGTAVFESATSRAVYTDGAYPAGSSESRNPTFNRGDIASFETSSSVLLGHLAAVWIWNCALPPALIRRHAADPFCMFRKRNVSLLVPPAGSGSGSVEGTDSGVGSESGSIAAGLSVSDSGIGVEAVAILSVLSSAEAASGSESATLFATLVGDESGTGGESGVIPGAEASDSAIGVEVGSILAALSSSDSAQETLAVAIVAVCQQTDAASSVEQLLVLAILAALDSATALDNTTVIRGELVSADAGTGSESDGSGGGGGRPLRRFRVAGRPRARFEVRGRPRAKYEVTGYAGASDA